MSEENPIVKFGKFLNREPRAVYLLLFIISFAGALAPPRLPSLPADSWSQAVFDSIEKLKPGDVVMVLHAWGSGNERCNFIGWTATVKHILARGACYITWSTSADAQATFETLYYWPLFNVSSNAEMKAHPLYGKQFVDFGFVSGGREPLVYGMAANIRKVVTKDKFGTKLDDIPMMKKVYNATNISLHITYGSYAPPSCWNVPVGAYYLQYGVPCIGSGEGEIFSEAAYLQQAGLLKGLAGCALGQREYEALVIQKYGIPNISYTQAGQILYAGITVIVGMLLNNIYQLVIKKRGD